MPAIMSPSMPEEIISREVAVGRIRLAMIDLCGSGKSACQIAADRNILCRGFNRDSDEELCQRYAPYVGAAERMSRDDLERAASCWQLARMRTEDARVACDVQFRHYQICRGWNEFSNEELSDFCFELAGARSKVIGEITLPNI